MQTTPKLKVLDLFSGIGGFSLGLERTGGFITEAFCEIEPYCIAVLNKHWPGVPVHGDIRSLTIQPGEFNVITGGFPCQDISLAGKGAGLSGERSGLWREFLRLIKEGLPDFTIIENSPALRSRGLAEILRGLSEIGYDAEWHCIPASSVGACHQRDRVWVVANRREGRFRMSSARQVQFTRRAQTVGSGADVSDCYILGQYRAGPQSPQTGRPKLKNCPGWASEPSVDRVVHGFPCRVDRIRALGNSIVPQIPEAIGYAILNWLDTMKA